MNKYERAFFVLALIFISLAAISWIGGEYFALLAAFEVLVGFIMGMVVFLPNRIS